MDNKTNQDSKQCKSSCQYNIEDSQKTQPLNKLNKDKSITSKISLTALISRTSKFSRIFERRKNVDDVIQQDIISSNVLEIEKNDITPDNLVDVKINYDFVYKFAEGGQGYIYSAIDNSLGRLVAIKALRSELIHDKDARNNFISEAKITAQLDHPGIIPIYSLNSDEKNNLYLAMKLIHGQPLSDYLDKIRHNYQIDGISNFDEENSIKYRLEIILRSCDALAYAHSRNIMHCDLKPENIMIGEFHESFITDWGISRFIKEEGFDPAKWKKPDKLTGTPSYLSPEAVAGQHTDERADIYSLGLILFKTIFLKNAFDGATTKEILLKINSHKIASFRHKFKYKVSKDLVAIIKKATAHSKYLRYQSVTAMAADIRNYLNNEAISARYDMFWIKLIRWGKRHITLLLLIALLGLSASAINVGYNLHIQKFITKDSHLQNFNGLVEFSSTMRKLGPVAIALNKVENDLIHIANNVAFIYDNHINSPVTQADTLFVNTHVQNKYIYSSLYCSKINLNKMGFSHGNSLSNREAKLWEEQFQHLPYILFTSMINSLGKKSILHADKALVDEVFFQSGGIILSLNIALNNGFFAQYPAQENLPQNYDPRNDKFYKDAINEANNETIIWSVPTYSEKLNMFICTISLPIYDQKNQIIGVVSAELPLKQFDNIVAQNGIGSEIKDILLLNQNGEIIFRRTYDYSSEFMINRALENNNTITEFFSDKNAFASIKKRKIGIVYMNNKAETNIIYSYIYLPNLKLFYIEKIDLADINVKNNHEKLDFEQSIFNNLF